MKVIIVNQGVPGTAEAFAKVKARRPDIICMAGEAHEDPETIARAADLVVNSDFIARGYLLPHSARQLGADTLVHISFPRHMIDESISRRRAIMEEACADLGIKFFYENSLDPIGEAGVEGAQKYIMDKLPEWLEKYGPNTAFFSTSDAHAEPLIRQITALGGYFVEADIASPMLGYPAVFDFESKGESSRDWGAIVSELEKKVVAAGAGGRLGTWVASLAFCHTVALTEFGRLLALNQAQITDINLLLSCYRLSSPGVRWNGAPYVDVSLKKTFGDYLLIFQDTYILGQGYLGTPELEIPEKYLGIKIEKAMNSVVPAFHIGIVTGSDEQGAEDRLGAEEMLRYYGSVDDGGLIRHFVYHPDFMEHMEDTSELISSLANDPLMKVIVVNQAVPGTSEGFRRVKSRRPDILCMAGEAHEDAEEIASTADLVVISDFVSRGYLIPHSAKKLNADTLVHISFERHMNYESMRRRMAIMEEASRDLGLKFAFELAPDPLGETGIDGARQFITNQFPHWIEKYGPNTAFFCTNDAHTEPLIRQITRYGGLVVEADIPSPLLGYPEAFDLDFQNDLGNWPVIMSRIEKTVVDAGAGGRLGTWSYPLGFIQTSGMVEFGKMIVEGRAKLGDTNILLDCFSNFSPGANWNGAYFTDELTGKPLRNYFLIYQDTYIFGHGYLSATSVTIPDKYYFIRSKK
jgi:DNA-binding LacI/PurR family transcriptional regulator